MSVIFLAGAHGVGKGFLGEPVARSIGIIHLTASQLIREEKGLATWGTDKNTSNLADNQMALIRAVGQRRMLYSHILLDGHFVLRNVQGVLTPLESKVFKNLHLNGVILLKENADIIASRLALRDRCLLNVHAISELAAAELSHAKTVCNELELPLMEIHAPSFESLTDAVIKLLDLTANP